MATRCEILRLFYSNIPSHSILSLSTKYRIVKPVDRRRGRGPWPERRKRCYSYQTLSTNVATSKSNEQNKAALAGITRAPTARPTRSRRGCPRCWCGCRSSPAAQRRRESSPTAPFLQAAADHRADVVPGAAVVAALARGGRVQRCVPVHPRRVRHVVRPHLAGAHGATAGRGNRQDRRVGMPAAQRAVVLAVCVACVQGEHPVLAPDILQQKPIQSDSPNRELAAVAGLRCLRGLARRRAAPAA